ncbi:MAG: Uma2 family endonuclease [Cyclobacteriaceae bacterium]|nr:Uma2 family endonuclease [Cyclobacteriaceae bacterium]
MAITEQKRKYTPEEYLALERKVEYKSEFFRGEIFAMSGASHQHNVITINLIALLAQKLKGKSCRPYGSDMRIHIPINSLYTYPDLSVVCGKEVFIDNEFDTLLNPVFICEVLSRSTADYDTGGKFTLYRSIESLKEYWVISSLEYRLQKFVKQSNNTWLLSETVNINDTVTLECLSVDVPLQEVYLDVVF